MFLGIEIGGTKLQLGVASGDGSSLAACRRLNVDPMHGAAGILTQIEQAATDLAESYAISRVGIGFGGPVDSRNGRTIKSHQISGWEDFELAAWCQQHLSRPAVVGNDCDVACLAEATYGAGRGRRSVFYVTVGTGVGGGYVNQGVVHGAGRPAIAEIGHLRPGLHADRADATVESMASGLGIAEAARARISGQVALSFESRQHDAGWLQQRTRQLTGESQRQQEADKRDLLDRAGGELGDVTCEIVSQAATSGNEIAIEVIQYAVQVLGWAIAQTITLLAPEAIVVGGGVSLMGEDRFFAPLRQAVATYVFPPLRDTYVIVPAALGEHVVVYGAIALAAANRGGGASSL